MIRVGIVGATGYTGLELIRLLLRHPQVQITQLTSRQSDQVHIADVHPALRDRLDLWLQPLDDDLLASSVDFVFSCLPHAASAEVVMRLLDHGLRVVDFSADYRLNDVDTYHEWYQSEHPDPERVGKTVYGLPEFFAGQIREAPLVANPGCFPTSAVLALAPLVQDGWVSVDDVVIDSKTGVTGAGRTPKLPFHFPECNENVSAYGVGAHRHTPEIQQILGRITGRQANVIFTPHLVPIDRGILTTIYAPLARDADQRQLLEALRQAYRDAPFVRVTPSLPSTKDVTGTNFCDVTARVVGGRAILVSAIDNLVKGAAGAAVQNFNLMTDQPETTGLL